MTHGKYVLISACRNEAGYIEQLIETIGAQTVLPTRWLIVDDGSTDATYELAKARGRNLPFLEIIKMPGGRPRSFSSQVYAAQHGYESIKNTEFDFVGFFDADLRVEPSYYERLLEYCEANHELGLVGGGVMDLYKDRTDYIRKGSENFHVPGGVQFFRRECFEQIHGYVPIDGGGQDTIAEVMAMMKGWKVRALPELKVLHLRPDGFSKDNVLQHGLKWGRRFHMLGYHPLFYFAQCVRRSWYRPILIGSVCRFVGFALATLKQEARPVGKDFVQFHRQLQMRRLRRLCAPRAGLLGDSPSHTTDA